MRILLIEDDHFFQNFYSSKLKEAGFDISVAVDGEEGMIKANEITPDLILLDIILPKKDGFEVLEELGKNEHLKNIPVLVFSTLGQEQDIERARQLGARDYVNKTFFDFDKLVLKINELTRK